MSGQEEEPDVGDLSEAETEFAEDPKDREDALLMMTSDTENEEGKGKDVDLKTSDAENDEGKGEDANLKTFDAENEEGEREDANMTSDAEKDESRGEIETQRDTSHSASLEMSRNSSAIVLGWPTLSLVEDIPSLDNDNVNDNLDTTFPLDKSRNSSAITLGLPTLSMVEDIPSLDNANDTLDTTLALDEFDGEMRSFTSADEGANSEELELISLSSDTENEADDDILEVEVKSSANSGLNLNRKRRLSQDDVLSTPTQSPLSSTTSYASIFANYNNNNKKKRRTGNTSYQTNSTAPGQNSTVSPAQQAEILNSILNTTGNAELAATVNQTLNLYNQSGNGNNENSFRTSPWTITQNSARSRRGRNQYRRRGNNWNSANASRSNSWANAAGSGSRRKVDNGARRNIRSIFTQHQLSWVTIKAEQQEQDRVKRVKERQKLYNEIFPTSKTPEGTLVLDFDAESRKPVIEIDKTIVQHLKGHQEEGIKFMYSSCFESVDMVQKKNGGGGCILAHCMGLGKTLQSVAFTHTILSHKEITDIETVLIVCPLSTVTNWYNEYERWLKQIAPEKRPVLHRLWENVKNLGQRVNAMKAWKKDGGVGIIHYDLFRNLVEPNENKKMTLRKPKKSTVDDKHREVILTYLLNPGPDMVICDEGHLLKNCNSKLSKSLNQVKTLRRIALTGTPLQNNLVEYHTMLQFVKPDLLGTIKEFKNRFANPIKNGQCKDSNPLDVQIMKNRSYVLHLKLDGCVQRLDFSILQPYLQPKYEYCIFVKLTEKQKELYEAYLETEVLPKRSPLLPPLSKAARVKLFFLHYSILVKILAHPKVLQDKIDDEEEDFAADFFDDDDEDDKSPNECRDDADAEEEKKLPIKSKSKQNKRPNSKTHNKGSSKGAEWLSKYFENDKELDDPDVSGKLVVLQEILKMSELVQDKVLIFSQFLTTLNFIEDVLEEWDQKAVAAAEAEGIDSEKGRWRVRKEYFRIDGSVKTADRQFFCDIFNSKKPNNRAKLFLISTRAGGLGINLHGANRVVMFDASWNPSNDMQSIFRVYRLGQEKPCYIYRLIAQGSIEEKIYNRQVVKLSLSSRVVDEHQVERHFNFEDLDELFRYEPEMGGARIHASEPEDKLLVQLLATHKDSIHSYQEHDSLLVNKVDEKLTAEEQKKAVDEFNQSFNNPLAGTNAEDTKPNSFKEESKYGSPGSSTTYGDFYGNSNADQKPQKTSTPNASTSATFSSATSSTPTYSEPPPEESFSDFFNSFLKKTWKG